MDTQYDICNGAETLPIYFRDEALRGLLSNFDYVCCNIPGVGTDTTNFEESILGCTCTEETPCVDNLTNECSCVHRSHGRAYNDKGQLNEEFFLSSSGAIFECNSLCMCSPKCPNRIVQSGIKYNLEVFNEEKKGLSLRSLDPILRHTFVCEYAGEILTPDEATRRFRYQATTNDMNYIFLLREHFANEILATIVDPKFKGNIGRFLNHSCEPNLCLVPIRVHNMVPKLCLFATRDISVGEELTYDYSSGETSETDALHSEDGISDRKVCNCGAHKCKGYLPFDGNILKRSVAQRKHTLT